MRFPSVIPLTLYADQREQTQKTDSDQQGGWLEDEKVKKTERLGSGGLVRPMSYAKPVY